MSDRSVWASSFLAAICSLAVSGPIAAEARPCENQESPAQLAANPSLRSTYNSLKSLQVCKLDNSTTACNYYVANAVKTLFGLTDFLELGHPPTANEIADLLAGGYKNWIRLGTANLQDTLNNSAAVANQGKAVIAVIRRSAGSGHVAIILPGTMLASGTWGSNVPNAASRFLPRQGETEQSALERSFVFCKLSEAFLKAETPEVIIYAK